MISTRTRYRAGEGRSSREIRQEKRRLDALSKNALLREMRREISAAPDVVDEREGGEKKKRLEEKERAREKFEEDHFIRLTLTRYVMHVPLKSKLIDLMTS